VGGGFSRYSVDAMWQAPHFEKMLYDNALLLGILAEAYQITKKQIYFNVMQATFKFLQRELCNGKGGYYAALDADSEGVEGKFYTWSYDELKAVIDPTIFDDFIAYYQVAQSGNWEHTNILWTQNEIEKEWEPAWQNEIKKLFDARAIRIRPALDHKVILGWNAMLIVGFCKMFAATGNKQYKASAIECIHWIEENLYHKEAHYFYHSCANGTPKAPAFLDDYANLIQAYIQLQEITGDINYLIQAKKWMDYVLQHFIDEEGLYFYYTASYQKDVIIRKKESYDGAQPSGNALICSSLYYLGHVFDLTNWTAHASKMMYSMRPSLLQYPGSFGCWAQTFYQMSAGMTELVGVGPTVYESLHALNAPFLPNGIRITSQGIDDRIALLKDKKCIDNQYFICKNNSCSQPMPHVDLILANI
jgi:uncharacterized protein YyaL (SSP411 family)